LKQGARKRKMWGHEKTKKTRRGKVVDSLSEKDEGLIKSRENDRGVAVNKSTKATYQGLMHRGGRKVGQERTGAQKPVKGKRGEKKRKRKPLGKFGTGG